MSKTDTTPEGSDVEYRRGCITKALQHYYLMDHQMRQAVPGLIFSGWQDQFLMTIAKLADRVEDDIKRGQGEPSNGAN